MKTTAFVIRVVICFLLSLIPASEFENGIYSARLAVRAQSNEPTSILIVTQDLATTARTQGAAVVIPVSGETTGGLMVDSDGMVRRAILLPPKGVPTGSISAGPSPAYQAGMSQGMTPEQFQKPQSAHLINYLGPAGSFPHCQRVLKDCPPLKGKIVVIDQESDNPFLLRTPVGEMSRAEIIANDIRTVAFHHRIASASWPFVWLLILAMILVAAYFIIYYPVLISAAAIVGTGIVVVVVLFQLIFQFFDLYIPSANIGGSLLITYLIFTGYRLAFQENLQWRSLKQAQYLRELDQMKTNFLSLVSHDLKTPIAKIQAITERLKREVGPTKPEWKELLESIENSNNELKHYITSILNLSKLESQKVILNKKSNDINQLILQALKRLKPLATQKAITVEEKLDPLFSVECDEDLMRQVVTNLIDNAIKYSPQGSRVIVRSLEEEGFIRVEVQDFGPGIPKDQLPLMFRKFSRFLRPIQEQVKGTGLGLYLSKYFIELHGGTIRVQSEEGKGTTFTFTLPLHGVESEAILG